jgi:hypothetical protein
MISAGMPSAIMKTALGVRGCAVSNVQHASSRTIVKQAYLAINAGNFQQGKGSPVFRGF